MLCTVEVIVLVCRLIKRNFKINVLEIYHKNKKIIKKKKLSGVLGSCLQFFFSVFCMIQIDIFMEHKHPGEEGGA